IAVTAIFAQDPKFGLKAGLNVSKLTASGYDWRAGFHGGLISHIHVTPAFSLQPEVMYSSQGAKYDFVNDQQVTRKLNYVNIPVLLQYNFNNGFRLQGGPQIGLLIGAKDKLGDVDINTVDTDDFNSIDFSIPVGISYLSYAGLGVDARYNIGVTNVIEGSTANVRNSVFQFGLFYLFDHHHKARSK
ncbi:MAG TPA: porin family protein, partial [Flavisolibacter sp.]|nr:porin family protein [Flavisolibacter sp.]